MTERQITREEANRLNGQRMGKAWSTGSHEAGNLRYWTQALPVTERIYA